MAILSNLPTFGGNQRPSAGQGSGGADRRYWRRAAIAWWLFLISQVLLVLLPRMARSDTAAPSPAPTSSARRDWPERIPPVDAAPASAASASGASAPGRVLLVAAWLRQQEPPDAPRTPQELPTPPKRALQPQEIVPSVPPLDRQISDLEKPVTAVRPRLATTPGDLPPDVARSRALSTDPIFDGSLASRRDVNTLFAWEAPALCHGPIYIEDVNLERYGYSHGVLQPAYSAVHFLGSVAILPYLAGAYPQRDCTYTLGYYRPGSIAPDQPSLPRFSLRGAALQGGILTGVAAGIPGLIP